MSAIMKASAITRVAALSTSAALVAAMPSTRGYFSRVLGIGAPGGVWRALFILLAVLNFKNVPFVWHWRVLYTIYYHVNLEKHVVNPKSIFKPIIMPTRTPIAELDYNMHKSNSTYFTDLDISRTHLMSILLRAGKAENNRWKGETNDGLKRSMAFGGVTCHFRREIKPYVKVEVWTRLLAWDRKWVYLVSHMVKAGVARPSEYELQPWKKGKGKMNGQVKAADDEERKKQLKEAIYATSISKYVFKKGRITVPPAEVLEVFGLIPPKPAASSGEGLLGSEFESLPAANGDVKPKPEDAILPEATGEEWTWETVEAERLRGMKLAELFAGLDGLHDEFNCGDDGVLGEYSDTTLF